jgi:hypothetical protein
MSRKLEVSDIIGETFGHLTVIEEVKEKLKGGKHLLCSCVCGEVVVRRKTLVTTKRVSSCGCNGLPSLGTTFTNKIGLEYSVLRYIKVKKGGGSVRVAEIRFTESGYIRTCAIKHLKDGAVKDLYHPSIGGVGYVGEGSYKTRDEDVVCYQTWLDMIKRCYAPKTKQAKRDYEDVYVCEDWHNYQSFAKWFYKYHVEGFRLDKDLQDLTKRCYSPETCTFLPVELNSFFTGGLKRGIHYNKKRRKWVAQCQNGELCEKSGKKKQTYLGAYEHEQEALEVYRDFKRDKLEVLLEKYKEYVTPEIISNTHQIINEIK